MQEILFDYKLSPTTWAYISALMMIGTYFKFHRFWSVRNSDLIALIAYSPALLLIYNGILKQTPDLVRAGYVWLFVMGVIFLGRLLLDAVMVRRPLLEPNLSASGLTFTGVSLLVFLMANVITNPPERLEKMLENPVSAADRAAAPAKPLQADAPDQTAAPAAKPETPSKRAMPGASNPGYALFYHFSSISNRAIIPADPAQPDLYRESLQAATHCTAVILAHLALVAGMVWIGYRHFDNIHTGVAAATLYLLSFYTSQFTGQMDHVAPAALLVWAAAAYRRPAVAGVLLGLAAGVVYYPLFLLPLWLGFYWRRGAIRFAAGVTVALGVLVASLALSSPDAGEFSRNVQMMFGWRNPVEVAAGGFWQYYNAAFRLPVLAAFVALSFSLALWPAQKNFGTLLSCSAAVMLGAQFWLAHQGGLYMAWYLPLLILTIFRPNLEDRVAISAVRPAWGWKRS